MFNVNIIKLNLLIIIILKVGIGYLVSSNLSILIVLVVYIVNIIEIVKDYGLNVIVVEINNVV